MIYQSCWIIATLGTCIHYSFCQISFAQKVIIGQQTFFSLNETNVFSFGSWSFLLELFCNWSLTHNDCIWSRCDLHHQLCNDQILDIWNTASLNSFSVYVWLDPSLLQSHLACLTCRHTNHTFDLWHFVYMFWNPSLFELVVCLSLHLLKDFSWPIALT